MANDLFNDYLSYAEEKAIEFAKQHNLEEEDIKQDALVVLFEMSEKYQRIDGDFHFFGKYLDKALLRAFIRSIPEYSVVRYPAYIAPHIHYISKVYDFDKSFDENVQVVKIALELSDEDAIEETTCFLTVYSANHSEPLDEKDFANHCLEMAKEKAFDDFFNECKTLNVINVIREFCTDRESDIIARNLGFCGEVVPLYQMAPEYNVCKQRIGQIYQAGITKLQDAVAKREILIALEIGC